MSRLPPPIPKEVSIPEEFDIPVEAKRTILRQEIVQWQGLRWMFYYGAEAGKLAGRSKEDIADLARRFTEARKMVDILQRDLAALDEPAEEQASAVGDSS